MGAKRPVAPDTPIRSFPTPNIDDLVVLVDVDSRLPGYKPLEYGTPHPDQTRFPGAKLVYQEPLENSDQFVRRVYATDRAKQDAHNYALKFSGGSPDHPIYIRSYVQLREAYSPLPDGSRDPQDDNAFIVEEETAPIEGELNSLYIRVTRVFETLPGPVITSFSTNEVGQKVTVTSQRKSSQGYALPAASAVSSPAAQSEDTGVITEQIQSVPEVFRRKQFSSERPDMLPQKFRAAVPDIETSELVEGEAVQPELEQGDISASEAQQTLFLKQVSRRSRTAPEYPVVITETAATQAGQLATITSTLDDDPQTADTGPLVESSEVTDLGDGRTIKVTTSVDEVFPQASYQRTKDDPTPPKFRSAVTETVTETTVPGQAEMPVTLGPLEILKSETQINVDRKRVRVQERVSDVNGSLESWQFTSELGGGIATVTETYPYNGPDPDTEKITTGTIEKTVETLANGLKYKREAKLPTTDSGFWTDDDGRLVSVGQSLPILRGQEYDEALDIVLPYKQVVANPENTILTQGARSRVTPRDVAHSTVIKYDLKDIQEALGDYFWEIPDMVQIALPDKLLKAYVVSDSGGGSGRGQGAGNTYFYNESGNRFYRGKIAYDIEEGFKGNIPATRAVFFLPKDKSSPQDVLQRVRAKIGPAVDFFPNARPQAHELLVFGGNSSFDKSRSVSFDSVSTSESRSGSSTIDFTTIPATIHPQLRIGRDISDPLGGSLRVRPNNLPATKPYASFPTGKFIYQINASPYKFSYVQVEAVIVEITKLYV